MNVSVIHCGPKPPSRYFCIIDNRWVKWDFSHDPEENRRRNRKRSLLA